MGSSLSFPKKSADSQTGPTTSNLETSDSGGGGETSSMCFCVLRNKNVLSYNSKEAIMHDAVVTNIYIFYLIGIIKTGTDKFSHTSINHYEVFSSICLYTSDMVDETARVCNQRSPWLDY